MALRFNETTWLANFNLREDLRALDKTVRQAHTALSPLTGMSYGPLDHPETRKQALAMVERARIILANIETLALCLPEK